MVSRLTRAISRDLIATRMSASGVVRGTKRSADRGLDEDLHDNVTSTAAIGVSGNGESSESNDADPWTALVAEVHDLLPTSHELRRARRTVDEAVVPALSDLERVLKDTSLSVPSKVGVGPNEALLQLMVYWLKSIGRTRLRRTTDAIAAWSLLVSMQERRGARLPSEWPLLRRSLERFTTDLASHLLGTNEYRPSSWSLHTLRTWLRVGWHSTQYTLTDCNFLPTGSLKFVELERWTTFCRYLALAIDSQSGRYMNVVSMGLSPMSCDLSVQEYLSRAVASSFISETTKDKVERLMGRYPVSGPLITSALATQTARLLSQLRPPVAMTEPEWKDAQVELHLWCSSECGDTRDQFHYTHCDCGSRTPHHAQNAYRECLNWVCVTLGATRVCRLTEHTALVADDRARVKVYVSLVQSTLAAVTQSSNMTTWVYRERDCWYAHPHTLLYYAERSSRPSGGTHDTHDTHNTPFVYNPSRKFIGFFEDSDPRLQARLLGVPATSWPNEDRYHPQALYALPPTPGLVITVRLPVLTELSRSMLYELTNGGRARRLPVLDPLHWRHHDMLADRASSNGVIQLHVAPPMTSAGSVVVKELLKYDEALLRVQPVVRWEDHRREILWTVVHARPVLSSLRVATLWPDYLYPDHASKSLRCLWNTHSSSKLTRLLQPTHKASRNQPNRACKVARCTSKRRKVG